MIHTFRPILCKSLFFLFVFRLRHKIMGFTMVFSCICVFILRSQLPSHFLPHSPFLSLVNHILRSFKILFIHAYVCRGQRTTFRNWVSFTFWSSRISLAPLLCGVLQANWPTASLQFSWPYLPSLSRCAGIKNTPGCFTWVPGIEF